MQFIFLFLVCLLILPLTSLAEGDSFVCKSAIKSAAASERVKKVQSAWNKLQSMKAVFSQTSYLASLGQEEVSRGAVAFKRQAKMRWDYVAPEKQTFIIDGTTVWLYQPELNQAVIDEFQKVIVSQLPVAFLLGVGELDKDFVLKNACNTEKDVVLGLEPAKKSGPGEEGLKSMELLTDSKTFIPKGARVYDISGNVTSIVFEDMVVDPAGIADDLFKPVFPPGTDINDRRKE